MSPKFGAITHGAEAAKTCHFATVLPFHYAYSRVTVVRKTFPKAAIE